MRPFPGDDAFLRPRASDSDGTPSAFHASNAGPQMSYIIADEELIDASLSSSPVFAPTRKGESRKAGSHYAPDGAEVGQTNTTTNTSSSGSSSSSSLVGLYHHNKDPRDEQHNQGAEESRETLRPDEKEKDGHVSTATTTPPFQPINHATISATVAPHACP